MDFSCFRCPSYLGIFFWESAPGPSPARWGGLDGCFCEMSVSGRCNERVHFKVLEKKGKKREILCYYVRKSRMLRNANANGSVLCVLSEVHSRDTYLPVHTPRTNFIGLYPGGTSWLHVYCT